MKNGWLPWLQLAAVILVPLVVVPLMRALQRLRANEIHALETSIVAVTRRLDRIEEKLDEHLTWHLSDGRRRPP